MSDYYFNWISPQEQATAKMLSSNQVKFLSEKVADHVIKTVRPSVSCSDKLDAFKSAIKDFVADSLLKIHCANLRTTSLNGNLFEIARQFGIPNEAFPMVSIIVTSQCAFYFNKDSKLKHIIVS